MRWVAVLFLLVACVDTGPGAHPKLDKKTAKSHMLAAAPDDITRFDLVLGKSYIKYLGNKIDRPRLVPGQAFTITHYWEVVGPTSKRWRPFTLVRGPAGSIDFMNLERSDMQSVHEHWHSLTINRDGSPPRMIVEDRQTITIRPDWTTPYAFVYVGFIEVGKHGTLDRMAVDGPKTQDRAIVAAKLEVDLSRAPPPQGTIHIPRASGPITVDGMQIDQGWTNALLSPEFVTADGSPDPIGKATARITYDDQNLYLFVSVSDTDVTSPYKNHDDSLWKADCVEIFIDADGNRRGYIEVQVNPRNTKFDSWFAGPRGPAGDVTWSSNMQTEVKVRGTADPGDGDQGWDAEIAIPWVAVKGRDEAMPVTIPPRIGDRWRINVVRVDVRSGNDKQSASSWNRIGYGDWHALDRMLVAVFADPTGSIVPSAEQPVPGGGSAGAPGGGSAGAPGGGSASAPGSGSAGAAAPIAPLPGTGSAIAPPPGTGSATRAPSPSTAPPSAAGSASRAPSPSGSASRAPSGSATQPPSGAPAGSASRAPSPSGSASRATQPPSGAPAGSASRTPSGAGSASRTQPPSNPAAGGTPGSGAAVDEIRRPGTGGGKGTGGGRAGSSAGSGAGSSAGSGGGSGSGS